MPWAGSGSAPTCCNEDKVPGRNPEVAYGWKAPSVNRADD